jgi:hypothetical protein
MVLAAIKNFINRKNDFEVEKEQKRLKEQLLDSHATLYNRY